MKIETLKMPLKARVVTPEAGQPYLALTDSDGQVIPGQQATGLECTIEALPVLTVQFILDGEDLILV